MKIRINLLNLILFLSLSAKAKETTSNWITENYTKREVAIPMRDGVKLFTAIYEPKDVSQKQPILLFRTPYSISPYGKNKFNSSLWHILKEFTCHHYIIVFQDVRGRYMSEGAFEEIRPFNPTKRGKKEIDESSDSYDTVDWLLKHTHNNGNVGVEGTSYGGFYAAMAGFSGHPAIKAVSPQAPVVNWFIGDDIHHNGALMLADSFGFLSGMEQPRKGPSTTMQQPSFSLSGNLYEDYLKTGPVRNFTTIAGDSLRFWNDVVTHPDYDNFWQIRDARTGCKKVKPAVLIVGGQFDAEDLYGTMGLYYALKKNSPKTPLYLAFGPWYHGAWNSENYENLGQVYFGGHTVEYFQKEILFPFFDYYLSGKGKAPAQRSIFFTGENQWKTEKDWPLKAVQPQSLYLNTNQTLSFDVPQDTDSHSDYVSDPQHPVPYTSKISSDRGTEYMVENQCFASERPDVLTFQSSILKDTLTLSGPIEVELYTSISTTDADFVVKLIDVYPSDFSYPDDIKETLPDKDYPMSDYKMLVRGDIMRGKYRDSFTYPKPFEPGKITKVNFSLADVAHSFLPGHRLMVQVQSSWFPLADRNPQIFTNIYTCNDSAFTSTNIHIYHQKDAASKLILPIVKNE